MRILYVAMKWDYGDPRRGSSFEHNNFYDTLARMPEHTVSHFAFDEVMLKKGRGGMNKALLAEVGAQKPDLVFFCLFTDEIEPRTVETITKRSGAITVNWFADDHWRFFTFSRHWAPLFHWVVTTDSRAVAEYRRIGCNKVIRSQWACNHFSYRRHDLPLDYPVTFVGQPHSSRRRVVKELQRAGIEVQCWGHGWPNGRIGQDEMIRMFSRSKVCLNFAESSAGLAIKSLMKIFLNRRCDGSIHLSSPRTWTAGFQSIKGRWRTQIKGRNFEIPGAGGFLLTSMVDDLEEYYLPGKEIAIFATTRDLVDQIRFYLSHDAEREAIREAGYQRTLREHTYVHRFNEVFRTIGFVAR